MPHPWEIGDERQRWNGYLDERYPDPDVGAYVLRNKVNAVTYAQLRQREDDAVALRAPTLRGHGIPPSYDLEGLKAIHRHLFQDVYEWAGDVRTVEIAKGQFFAPADQAQERFARVERRIESEDRFRSHGHDKLAHSLMGVYADVNQAHPFREGNGRTQRVFVDALAAESGHGLDWERHHGPANDHASEAARNGNYEPLSRMFRDMLYVRDELPQPQRPPERDARGPFLDRFEEATPAQQRFLTAMAQTVNDRGAARLEHIAAFADASPSDVVGVYQELKAGSHVKGVGDGMVQFTSGDFPAFIRAHQNVDRLPSDRATLDRIARTRSASSPGSSPGRIARSRTRSVDQYRQPARDHEPRQERDSGYGR